MVRFILLILGSIVALNGLCFAIWVRLARTPLARRLVLLFMSAQLGGLAWLVTSRRSGADAGHWFSKWLLSETFIWHTLLLPLFLVLALVILPFFFIGWLGRRWQRRPVEFSAPSGWSRRQFLSLVASVAPPLCSISLTTLAIRQLDHFRLRRLLLRVPGLPPGLEGLTITQVSDMHVGRFTSGSVLHRVVEKVNQLGADLVLLTGDLINDALADLDEGISLVRAMETRLGLFLIEGNHDLIENGPEFERRVKASGIPFLLDESALISRNGALLQLLGLSWTRARQNRDEAIARSVQKLLQQRRPDAFSILLAHHPHAFDAAAEAAVPLTLSGHTHGGQLMWNDRIGFGPALFRYWSGLYARGNSQLVVSNGVGNWYPLRINAPAEIVHLTLLTA